jgi:hypothetical protein
MGDGDEDGLSSHIPIHYYGGGVGAANQVTIPVIPVVKSIASGWDCLEVNGSRGALNRSGIGVGSLAVYLDMATTTWADIDRQLVCTWSASLGWADQRQRHHDQ